MIHIKILIDNWGEDENEIISNKCYIDRIIYIFFNNYRVWMDYNWFKCINLYSSKSFLIQYPLIDCSLHAQEQGGCTRH